VNWHIAMMPGKRRALNLETASGQLRNAAERVKAGTKNSTATDLGPSTFLW
jgi:hypothetical protein